MALEQTDRDSNRWIIAWFGLLFCGGVYLWCMATPSFVADDSYFYVVIARNLATLGRQTFSNIYPTNGFHPLWCYLLPGYTWLVHSIAPSAVNQLAYAVPLGVLMLAGTVVQSWRMARALRLDPIVITSLIVGSILSLGVLYSEGPLFFLLLTTLLAMMARDPKVAETRPIAFGLITAAIVLARLDAIFFVGFVYLYYLWDVGLKPRTIVAAVVCGSLVGAYVLSNVYFFGGAMPISGWLKGNFPEPFSKGLCYFGLSRLNRASFGGYSLILGWVPILLGSVVLAVGRPKERMRLIVPLVLLAGAATQGAYIALYTRCASMWPWYYVLPITLLALSLALIAERWSRYFARPIILACVSLAVLWAYAAKAKPNDTPAFQTIEYLRRHQISGETILVSDWPGAVAYFTDNNELAADMLTSNRCDFEKMRSESNALDYLIAECRRLEKPIRQILIVGNSWLVWDDKTQELIYYDPRRYPVLVPIGKIATNPSADGGTVCDDGIPVGLVMANIDIDEQGKFANP